MSRKTRRVRSVVPFYKVLALFIKENKTLEIPSQKDRKGKMTYEYPGMKQYVAAKMLEDQTEHDQRSQYSAMVEKIGSCIDNALAFLEDEDDGLATKVYRIPGNQKSNRIVIMTIVKEYADAVEDQKREERNLRTKLCKAEKTLKYRHPESYPALAESTIKYLNESVG